MNKCYICHGKMEKKRITVEREWQGNKIIIEDVPASVCVQCTEQYFDAETTLSLERIKKASMYPQE